MGARYFEAKAGISEYRAEIHATYRSVRMTTVSRGALED
jgi:hypothetical protein